MFEEQIWSIGEPTDVIILPEMFTTGFTMEASEMAEPMGSSTFKWLQQMSEQAKAAIVCSYIVKEKSNYFNRLVWVTPDGNHVTYDKRHLFRMAKEHLTFTGGDKRLIVSWKGWNICPQICYDLRFPVWNRNTAENGTPSFDLLIFVANWPTPRISAWDTLLKARSIENLCYTVGVNRIGSDGNDVLYNGHSTVVNPKGNAIFFEGDKESIKVVTLARQELDQLREKFPVHMDADRFDIIY